MCVCVWWGVGGYREGDRDEFLLSKSKTFSFKNFFFYYQKTEFLLAEVLGKTSRFALDVV